MLFHLKNADPLGGLKADLRLAQLITADFLGDFIAEACVRLPLLNRSSRFRVDQLIAAGAWTEAALSLAELELPQWKLRRLVYEDGEWHCSLSLHPNLPIGLDDTADYDHETVGLAILGALLQAQERVAEPEAEPLAMPTNTSSPAQAMSCENFR